MLTSRPAGRPWLLLCPLLVLAAGCAPGIPPTVFTTTPADGSGNVPVTASITATFSSSMDATTITASTFTLSQGDTPIPGAVTCSGKTAIFTPASNLAGNAVFTATITTDVKDAAGVAVARNRMWTFMTVAGPAGSTGMYFVYTFGANPWTRSSLPVTLTNGANIVSQSANPDGSVTLTIANASGYEDNGFYYFAGTLSNLGSLRVVGTGTFSANLYLDVDNDGEFFTWGPPAPLCFQGSAPTCSIPVLPLSAAFSFSMRLPCSAAIRCLN